MVGGLVRLPARPNLLMRLVAPEGAGSGVAKPTAVTVSRQPLQNTPQAFASQLREGHFNELRVALHLMLRGCLVRIGFTDGRYDIEARTPRGRTWHVEVKWDKRAAGSGNLYFEVENTRQRKPSGVMSTSADLWCHVLGEGEQALMVRVPRLRQFLERGGFRSVHTGAADSNSRGLLVPRAALVGPDFGWIVLPTVEDYFGAVFRRGVSGPG